MIEISSTHWGSEFETDDNTIVRVEQGQLSSSDIFIAIIDRRQDVHGQTFLSVEEVDALITMLLYYRKTREGDLNDKVTT